MDHSRGAGSGGVRGESEPRRAPERHVVWGAGAMGGSLGAAWARAGVNVLFVDVDRAQVSAVREHGLRITGPVDAFTVRAPILTPEEVAARVAGGTEPPFRWVHLAVKAHHTGAALRVLAPLLAADGCVVSVQNGLNERVIAEAVGVARTVGCFVNFGADVVEPGVVHRGNRGAVVVGELDGALTPRIRALHALYGRFEPDALLTRNIEGFLWGKLAYGALLFATALTPASIADVLASPRHRPLLCALAREVLRVARARGIRPEAFDGFDPLAFDPGAPAGAAEATLDRLVAFNRASAKTHSGVWRDLAVRRRPTEVDAQIAPIATLGREVGVAAPLVERLVALVHNVEAGVRTQSWETLDALGTGD
ncbi:MAG: 2-dehydropantoate 2-reductase N-terminal domain-containing protein [Longimicrobiales bacterium]|nr:2-dehydropantoate 2-reductase N-terminal domain-containing protein [Longimicrobiales bacterium]